MKTTDSFAGHVRLLYRNMGSKILLGLLESLPLWMGLIFFQKSVTDNIASADAYGVYFGKYLMFCGLAFVLNAICITAVNAKVSVSVRKDEMRYAKGIFQSGMRIVMIHSLFWTVFTAIMAKQLAGIFEGSQAGLEAMFSFGSVLIVLVSLAFFFSRLLMQLGMDFLVCACAAVGDVVFVIAAVLMLNVGALGIMALVYAGILGMGIYVASTGWLACMQLRTGIDGLRTLAIPAGCACLMGLLCLLLGKIFTPHLGNVVTVVVCLILGGLLYWILLLLLRCFREQELEVIPGGKIIWKLGQFLHFL